MKMEDQLAPGFRSAALSVLEERKSKNPSYSLRAFAKNLGMNPGDLHRLLKAEKVPNIAILKRFLAAAPFEKKSDQKQFLNSLILEKLSEVLESEFLVFVGQLDSLSGEESKKIENLIDRFLESAKQELG